MTKYKAEDLENIRKYIAKVEWINAKTYTTAPHEYVLKTAKPELESDFISFVKFIRSNGYDEKFWNKTYRYFDIDGYQYWAMDDVIEKTVLINRAKRKACFSRVKGAER